MANGTCRFLTPEQFFDRLEKTAKDHLLPTVRHHCRNDPVWQIMTDDEQLKYAVSLVMLSLTDPDLKKNPELVTPKLFMTSKDG